ncbi:hypothetical protein ACV56Z_05770 [Staphylococcus aureus]
MPIKDIEAKYEGEGYGKFKGDLAEIVKAFLVGVSRKIRKFL